MNERDYIILKDFAEAVRARFPSAEIIAYGSRVRGDASEYSDFDVCVIVGELDESVDQAIMDIAWEIGFNNDIVISTITYSKYDFENGPISCSPFILSIRMSGIAA